ncbi:unnamed protein product [Paramecium octaurelia]|uniref:Uncharacterized protein n=1 Tax=Paramecium octaurelia TaxID=43137 RepID=A0A8S1S020_PAROT|nr:unnamed protein product [Paramecium octaurelia]
MNMIRGKNGDDFFGLPKANQNQNQNQIKKNEREKTDDQANKQMQNIIQQALKQEDNKDQNK